MSYYSYPHEPQPRGRSYEDPMRTYVSDTIAEYVIFDQWFFRIGEYSLDMTVLAKELSVGRPCAPALASRSQFGHTSSCVNTDWFSVSPVSEG